MRNLSSRRLVSAASFPSALLLCIASVGGASPVVAEAVGSEAAGAKVKAAYGKLPLQFEANRGQTDARVKFLSRGSGYSLFLTSTEAVLGTQGSVLRMRLVGASRAPRAEGLEELPGKVNYFIGNDPAKWRTNAPTYGKVRYQDVYPGVDLIYYGNQRQLEYDFVVAAGADPRKIALEFKGADELHVDSRGDLVLQSAGSQMRFRKPLTYQEVDGVRQEVAGRYVLKSRNRVGFQVAAYDRTRALIIDPVLAYSTFLGGPGNDIAASIAVDSAGNAYVTGSTSSADFPTTSGAFQPTFQGGSVDAFVAKLNASGSALVYSTFIGGRGSELAGIDGARGIAINASGNAYVTGQTSSPDFPTTSDAFQRTNRGFWTGFVAELSPDGAGLVYSTYLGGSLYDSPFGIAVDAAGNAHVTGWTYSSDFPTTPGAYQETPAGGPDNSDEAFVTKLNPEGSELVYSTYLGGSSNHEAGLGIAVDAGGNAYVTGGTSSIDFPTTTGAFQTTYAGAADGFVTKVNPDGSGLVYSTYLGGSGFDSANGIAVDSAGNAYVTGLTGSSNFPTTEGVFDRSLGASGYDAFVTKVNPDGTAPVYSTLLGGSSGSEAGNSVAVDASGNATVAGYTGSSDFPTTPGALDTTFNGGIHDAFVTRLNASGSALIYSTYLGGSGDEYAWGIALDPFGDAYVTGQTPSSDFPTTAGAFDTSFNGSNDVFVAKVALTPAPIALTVTKVVGNDNGGTKQVGDFTLFVDGSPVVSGVSNSFSVGVHTVSETSSPGYAATIGGDCGANGSITLNPGDAKNCTITNDDIPSIYLHQTGSSLILNGTAPTATAPKFKDSAGVAIGGGNPWREIGTWTATTSLFTGSVVGFKDLHVFVGLKNGDDESTRFDVQAEVYVNGLPPPLTSGQTLCVTGVTRNPDLAREVIVSLPPFAARTFGLADRVSVKVSTRIGTNGTGGSCGGHIGAVGLRLYFDAASRPSRLNAGP